MNRENPPAEIKTLCIPRILSNVTKEYITNVFNNLNLGKIHRIDIIRNKNSCNKVFIHFSKWNNNDNADIVKNRLLIGKDVKIVHSEPWFWKIVAFREMKQ
jgi:hypothetical protein